MVVGVDIGGSHITAALVDIGSRKIQEGSWKREAVDASAQADEIINAWAHVISDCFHSAGIEASQVGIAMPGPFDYNTGISWMKDQGKYRSLYGMNVGEMLAAKLGIAPSEIRFNNDAACFLQGELFSGSGRGISKAIGLTLGTGFGSAYASNGHVTDADLWCAPFKEGIAEDYFSNGGLVKRYAQIAGQSISSAKEIAAIAEHDTAAQQLFKQFGIELAEFLDPLIERHSTELLVIGGNIARSFPLFANYLRQQLTRHSILISETKLGENAALIGAASMWSHAVPAGS